jgi:hypothetical protein
MAFTSLGQRLGFVAVLALAPAFAVQTASAAQTELMVMVTPYIAQPTKQNESQTTPMLGRPLKTNPDSENQASSIGMPLDGAADKSGK